MTAYGVSLYSEKALVIVLLNIVCKEDLTLYVPKINRIYGSVF